MCVHTHNTHTVSWYLPIPVAKPIDSITFIDKFDSLTGSWLLLHLLSVSSNYVSKLCMWFETTTIKLFRFDKMTNSDMVNVSIYFKIYICPNDQSCLVPECTKHNICSLPTVGLCFSHPKHSLKYNMSCSHYFTLVHLSDKRKQRIHSTGDHTEAY